MRLSSLSHRDYHIGWICAVEPERIAAMAMLDEIYSDKLPAVDGDSNSYTFGTIGEHNVVIASLPSGTYGTNPATLVASQMMRSFKELRVRLLVGIGGGVPRFTSDDPADVRLGDVVVSDPTYHNGGVVQYDLGKTNEGQQRPERIGTLNKPPVAIRTAVATLKAKHKFKDHPLAHHLAQMIHRHSRLAPEYTYPGVDNDTLFQAGYKHEGRSAVCVECLQSKSVARPRRQSIHPQIHYGTIASGNQVVKDSITRDYWGVTEGVLCFEMEAAGLMDSFSCLVIRGICDYADSHKNVRWQPYAAVTAAAYAKDLLLEIAPTAVPAIESSLEEQPGSGNRYWMVLKNQNSLFTGRENILEMLNRNFGSQSEPLKISEPQRRFVITGDGGIGKSEVCLKFVNDHRQDYWGIFWIDASNEATARQAFMDIAKLCGTNASTFEQAKTWLANTHHSWLIIVDNADNPKTDYAMFFPSGNKGNIILTTRNLQCRNHATVGCEDLDHLDPDLATALLFKAAAIAVSLHDESRKAAEKFVKALGFHTLAIIQAGAFIRLRRCPLERYPALLQEQEENLLKFCLTQERPTYGSVYATFEISATHLESSEEQSAADALDLLGILGYFHFQEIPEAIFTRAWEEAVAIRERIIRKGPQDSIYCLSELQVSRLPPFMMQEDDLGLDLFLWRWREALNLLESYSLLKIDDNKKKLSFSMHPLAHTWARIRFGLALRKANWRVAGSIIALSMRGCGYNIFCEKLRSHVRTYLDRPIFEHMDELIEQEMYQTYYHICWLVLHLGDIPKLRSLIDTLETNQAWAGASIDSQSAVQDISITCLLEEERFEEALKLLQQLQPSAEDPRNLYKLELLARAYLHSGIHVQKAVDLLEHTVKNHSLLEARESTANLRLQHLLGLAYIKNGQYEKAAVVLEWVVKRFKEELDPVHPDRLVSGFCLGRAYFETNRYEEAASIFRGVLEIQRTILDSEDIYLLDTQQELARAYICMGGDHYEEVAELLEKFVEIRGKRSEPDHPSLLDVQHDLATAYTSMGGNRCERTVELYVKVIKEKEQLFSPEDPQRLALQYDLALAYHKMGGSHDDEATRLLEQVVQIQERTLAPDHEDLLRSHELLKKIRSSAVTAKDAKSASASGKSDRVSAY